VTEAEEIATEVPRRVFALGLAWAEGDEARWYAVLQTIPSELLAPVIRAMCASWVGLYEQLAEVLDQPADPKAYVIEGFRQELENTDG
jgi:hypothetical protein